MTYHNQSFHMTIKATMKILYTHEYMKTRLCEIALFINENIIDTLNNWEIDKRLQLIVTQQLHSKMFLSEE